MVAHIPPAAVLECVGLPHSERPARAIGKALAAVTSDSAGDCLHLLGQIIGSCCLVGGGGVILSYSSRDLFSLSFHI